jgi:hypothetical protein
MYWNNPLIELAWPNSRDPVAESFHNGTHCLYYNDRVAINNIATNQQLQDLANWAAQWLGRDGLDAFVADPQNHYDIANLVKFNLWIHDIRAQGIVKPWLLLDHGTEMFEAGTGDSRLKCLERIPEISHVPAFISTRRSRADLYSDLEPVTSFDQFANLCNANSGQQFMFRLTDPDAPFGMYWYEYNSDLTRRVTPGQDAAVAAFCRYYQQTPSTITVEWFDQTIDWQLDQ